MTSSEDKDQVEMQYDLDLIEDTIKAYQARLIDRREKGDIEPHPPHAIMVFARKTYDRVFQPMLQEALDAAMADAALAVDDDEQPVVDINEVLEQIARINIVNAFIAGYETREAGHSFHRCKCGDLTDDVIAELFKTSTEGGSNDTTAG